MDMSFRWYGESDKISLQDIKQIPGMQSIVSAIYDIPVGEIWSIERIRKLKENIENSGLNLSVIESVPVHEDIKLGKPSRDKYIENYKQTLINLATEGIQTVCYNFMPVFDWTRTDLAYELPDKSTTLIFDEATALKMNPKDDNLSLPGWDSSYSKDELLDLLDDYKSVDEECLWKNLNYFIQKIIPVAEKHKIKMAIHPDDPPFSIFSLPRIITNKENIERFIRLYDSPYNGVTICSGSLGSIKDNDVISILKSCLEKERVNFVHARNIKLTGERSFEESAHPSRYGSIDMYAFIKLLSDYGYSGPIRPDHGRMIWGETGKPGYGLYDRALGATYLYGLWEAAEKQNSKEKGK